MGRARIVEKQGSFADNMWIIGSPLWRPSCSQVRLWGAAGGCQGYGAFAAMLNRGQRVMENLGIIPIIILYLKLESVHASKSCSSKAGLIGQTTFLFYSLHSPVAAGNAVQVHTRFLTATGLRDP